MIRINIGLLQNPYEYYIEPQGFISPEGNFIDGGSAGSVKLDTLANMNRESIGFGSFPPPVRYKEVCLHLNQHNPTSTPNNLRRYPLKFSQINGSHKNVLTASIDNGGLYS